jgi:phosphoserine aminotransferase
MVRHGAKVLGRNQTCSAGSKRIDADLSQTAGWIAAIASWVGRTPLIDFLATRPETRSPTSICLKIADPEVASLPAERQSALLKDLTGLLAEEQVAYDIGGYRDAPPGLRLWGGATVETADLEALAPWLDHAFAEVRDRHLG